MVAIKLMRLSYETFYYDTRKRKSILVFHYRFILFAWGINDRHVYLSVYYHDGW
jgi:hypothetical protein